MIDNQNNNHFDRCWTLNIAGGHEVNSNCRWQLPIAMSTNKFDQKHHLSQRGLSNKKQLQNVALSVAHAQTRLDRWYKTITRPRPGRKIKVKVERPQRPSLPARQRTQAYYDAKLISLNKYKRSTHWVARSAEEYNMMYST